MKRPFLAALVAMGVAFAAILGAIWLATGPAGPPAKPPAIEVPGLEPQGLVSVDGVIDLGRSQLGGIPLPPPVIVKDEPIPPPPPGSWEAVPLVTPRGGLVGLDLEELQPLISDCFSPAIASRSGRITTVKDAAPLDDEAAVTVVLQLEVTRDELRVIDAPVESRGQASDGSLACVQSVLRGRTAPSAGLKEGRHRFRFTLQP